GWLTNVALYLEPEIAFGSLRVRPGVRMQYYDAKDAPVLEPRLRLVWEHGIHQLSAAAGLYHQDFVGLTDRRDAASVFTAWTTFPKPTNLKADDALAGRLPGAVHLIGGYRINPSPSIELSIEGFYKKLSSLLIAEWTSYPRFTTRLQPARGRSFGFDTRVEVRRAPFYGLVSYGLSSTRYEAEQAALQLWYGVERLRFRPSHDRRHQVNALLGTSFHEFDLNLHWAFGSGFPFSRVLGFDGFILMDGFKDVKKDEGTHRVIYERPFNAVLPTYHRLDVSVERTFPIGGADLTVQATAINLYDRRNIFYLDTFTLERSDQLPFVPSLGIKVSFE
ncbi:MAG TPA: hypothetical protein VFG50_14975, partial [Rhodothermales bacterium]|nr:hypothetical protein [Rhodothermales bacterium]